VAQRLAPTTTGAGSGFARTDGRSSTARGYGADWRRVRAGVLAGEPLCRICSEAGRVTAATEVDHVERFHGVDDPRRLDRSNLRPLCTPCHAAVTARAARFG
jgi:5-methylcytosine-specific restriction protein A